MVINELIFSEVIAVVKYTLQNVCSKGNSKDEEWQQKQWFWCGWEIEYSTEKKMNWINQNLNS